MSQLRSRWIETNGVVTRYAVSGVGDNVLVLVHEMGGSLESYDQIATALSGRRRVLRYDWRGSGMSQKVRGKLDIDDLAQDLESLLDVLGVHVPVALAGSAVGGAIALKFAATRPERVSALIAMSPSTGAPAARRPAMEQRARDLEENGIRAGMAERIPRIWPDELRTDQALFDEVWLRRGAADPFCTAAATRMLAELDIDADLARIASPCRVIAGTFDQERPPETCREVAARIPGAELRIIPSGHLMAMQTPSLVIAEFEDFLGPIGL